MTDRWLYRTTDQKKAAWICNISIHFLEQAGWCRALLVAVRAAGSPGTLFCWVWALLAFTQGKLVYTGFCSRVVFSINTEKHKFQLPPEIWCPPPTGHCKLIGQLLTQIASKRNRAGIWKRESEFQSTDWEVGHMGITGVAKTALEAELASDELRSCVCEPYISEEHHIVFPSEL